MDENAFDWCSASVIDLSHCASLRSIGQCAFQNCTSERIDLSNCTSLLQVGPRTFEGCSAGVITLSQCAALGYISERAFNNCGAHNIDLSGCTALESIGLDVFKGCDSLAFLDISDSTLFKGFGRKSLCCPKLETLRLPANAPMRTLLANVFGLNSTGPRHETLAKVTFVHTSAFKAANPRWFETVVWGPVALECAMQAAGERIRSLEHAVRDSRRFISVPQVAQQLPHLEAQLNWLQSLVAQATKAPGLCLPPGFEFDLRLFTLCPKLLFAAVTMEGVEEAIVSFGAAVPLREFLKDFPDTTG